MFQPDESFEQDVIAEDEDQPDGTGRERAVLCALCRQMITRSGEKRVVHGKHAHVLFNPAGIVFEVGCFGQAPGCSRVGPATLEFTWFDGYAWRICVCRSCQTHIGWHYQDVHGRDAFFGLILGRLLEGEV